MFDLRSKKERVVLPSPVVEGIETVWNANVEDDDNTREVKLVPIARFAEGEGELKGLEAWKERNTNVVSCAVPTIFEEFAYARTVDYLWQSISTSV